MDLNSRKREILAAIIKTYMETGEPVGSKILSNILGNRLSSATLRNEMSELCELGFLEQPHTSAGRAPTKEGYRFYITKLMPAASPDRKTTRHIDLILSKLPIEPELFLPAASELLADFTGLPALSSTVANKTACITKASLVRVHDNRFLIVVLTSDGMHGSHSFQTIWQLTEAQVSLFHNIVEAEVIGKKIMFFTPAILQELIAKAAENGLTLAPAFTALFDLAERLTDAKLSASGTEYLYEFSELYANAKQIIALISRRDTLISLLSGSSAPVSVVFGDDSGIDALKTSGMVIASYNIGNSKIGRIGIIGPTRMNYSHLVPSVEYFAKGISQKLQSVYELEE